MRIFKTLAFVAVGAAAGLVFFAPARAQVSECHVIGNWAGWGQNGMGTFDVGSGQSCTIGASTFGEIRGFESRQAARAWNGEAAQHLELAVHAGAWFYRLRFVRTRGHWQ